MQPSFRALCATILLSAAGAFAPAHATAPVIDTTGFILSASGGLPVAGVSLISDYPGHAMFSLWGVGQAAHGAVDTRGFSGLASEHEWQSGYALAVKDGYKITNITVTGEFYGALRPAQWTTPGGAGNDVGILFKIDAPGQPPGWKVDSTSTLDGHRAFRFEAEPGALTGDVSLALAGFTKAWAYSAWYQDGPGEDFWLGSYADAGIRDLRLSISVAPVPEPGTYAMLLAGLGLLGMARRRRR